MAKNNSLNTIDLSASRNGSFVFNAQDKENRIALGEKLVSVVFTPANHDPETGKFLTLGLDARFEERRAALNAIMRYWLEFDCVEGNFHRYSDLNPRREGGAMGWLHYGSNLPSNGSTNTQAQLYLGGKRYFANLPTRRVYVSPTGDVQNYRLDDSYVPSNRVSVNTAYVQVVSLGGDRVELKNGPIDQKTGKSLGALLHHYMGLLAEGVSIKVVVTVNKWTDPVSGEVKYLDGLQSKALFLMNAQNQDWAKLRASVQAEQVVFGTTTRELKAAIAKDPTLGTVSGREEVYETILAPRKEAEVNGTPVRKSGINIIVDGKKVDVAEVPSGEYNSFLNGKSKGTVRIARMSGATLLKSFAREGRTLETVRRYGTEG